MDDIIATALHRIGVALEEIAKAYVKDVERKRSKNFYGREERNSEKRNANWHD